MCCIAVKMVDTESYNLTRNMLLDNVEDAPAGAFFISDAKVVVK